MILIFFPPVFQYATLIGFVTFLGIYNLQFRLVLSACMAIAPRPRGLMRNRIHEILSFVESVLVQADSRMPVFQEQDDS